MNSETTQRSGSPELETVPDTGNFEEMAGSAETSTAVAEPEVHSVEFGRLSPAEHEGEGNPLEMILDVWIGATVELGRRRLPIREILALTPGSVIELDKLAGEPADLLVNGKLLARGEVVVIDENFGIRITEIITPTERITSLR